MSISVNFLNFKQWKYGFLGEKNGSRERKTTLNKQSFE